MQGEWIGCNAQVPQDEACDGFDSDCDGLVDEGLTCQCPPEMIGALIPCMEPPLSCGMGFKSCECDNEDCSLTKMTDCFALCHWLPPESLEDTCDPLAGMPVQPEVCNNFDEDCDGAIDERLFKTCYSGPDGTANIGVCREGQQFCQEGQWFGETTAGDIVLDFCAGENLPSREICDGADNDCDGETDFGQEIPETDILFILDWSGSMEYHISAVKMAMNRFATNYSAEEKLKWGLITGPRVPAGRPSNSITGPEYLKLETDITSFPDFMSAFSSAGAFQSGSSSEMLRDALYLSLITISTDLRYDLASGSWDSVTRNIFSVPPLQDFKVKWREDADRIIILFTDEEDQSYLRPKVTEEQTVAALESSPDTKKFYVFSGRYYHQYWLPYVDATGGQAFRLTNRVEDMYNDLMSILDEICLSDSEDDQYQPVSYRQRYDYIRKICY